MNRFHQSLYFAVLLALGETAALAATPPTAAVTAQEGVANAKTHAQVATKVDTLEGIHLHLHHVINCLEGPHGKLYSAKAESLSAYHCNGLDAGAANDPQAGPQVRKLAGQAVQEAVAGLHATTVGAGHRDAASVIKTLDALQDAWPKRT